MVPVPTGGPTGPGMMPVLLEALGAWVVISMLTSEVLPAVTFTSRRTGG